MRLIARSHGVIVIKSAQKPKMSAILKSNIFLFLMIFIVSAE